MKGVFFMDERLLSWSEIRELYPNQQVALTDVEWGNRSTVVRARVKLAEKVDNVTPTEIASLAVMSDGKIVSENTSDSLLCAGASTLC